MGAGIAGMHYAGMAAMRMEPGIRYDAALFAASIGIAVIASTAALWIAQALRVQQARHATAQRVGAAFIMGVGITGMHYTAMAAAHFALDARCGPRTGRYAWLATTVTLFTTGTLVVTLLLTRFDARTTFLRGMTDTLERLVRLRTVELERALHRYEQTTAMLQRTRENMATEIDERKARRRGSNRRRTSSGACCMCSRKPTCNCCSRKSSRRSVSSRPVSRTRSTIRSASSVRTSTR